jgi:hypothetical protein
MASSRKSGADWKVQSHVDRTFSAVRT